MTPTLEQVLAEVGVSSERASSKEFGDVAQLPETHDAPWFVRFFIGMGTWVGALIAATFLVALEVHEVFAAGLAIGMGMFAGAVLISRRARETVFFSQLTWVLGLGAEVLLMGVVAELDDSGSTMALTGLALQTAALLLIRNRSFRVASVIGLVGNLCWAVHEFEVPFGYDFLVLAGSGALALLWVAEAKMLRLLRDLWSPVAHALGIGLLWPLTILALQRQEEMVFEDLVNAPTMVSVGLGLITLAIVYRAARERDRTLGRGPGLLAALGIVAVVAVAHGVPGLVAGLCWLVLAHLRSSRTLEALALNAIAGFLFLFYYQLSVPLLQKSLWVLATGAVLVGGAMLLRRLSGREREQNTRAPAHALRDLRWLAVVTSVAVLMIGIQVWQKERLVAGGTRIYLELAPVDPRSLMQGDYMRLAYALEDELEDTLDPPDASEGSAVDDWSFDSEGPLQKIPRKGRLMVRIDPRGVGHFARIDEGGGELRSGEQRIRYRVRDTWRGSLRLGAESFMFEEGTADIYEQARYGELVVDEKGNSVLVGLRDEELRPLGVQLHAR